MSGGHWNYKNDDVCYELFNWDVSPTYGIESKEQKRYAKTAREIDPMEDIELSDLIYDVFCLIHSADWYKSGDNSEETYRKDVEAFKKKWFKNKRSDRLKEYVNAAVEELRDNLMVMIGEQEAEDG